MLRRYRDDAAADGSLQYFNGVTNWRRENFARALGMVGSPVRKPNGKIPVGHYRHTGDETYGDGEVPL